MPHLSPLTSHFSPRPSALPYNPALSLWLSADPLSDKYPNLSPYVYCANNPVKYFDPNGKEIAEWDLLRDGTLKLRENGRTDIDIVHATSDDGQSISRQYKANTISLQSETHTGVSDDGKPYATEYRSFSNNDAAIDFFEFAAENTDNEWAISGGRGKSFVGTAKQGSVSMPSVKNELFFCHSHKTNGIDELTTLSGSDYSGWEYYSKKGTTYLIYMTGSKTYYQYKTPKTASVSNQLIYLHTKDNWIPFNMSHNTYNH